MSLLNFKMNDELYIAILLDESIGAGHVTLSFSTQN